ncbi:MAG TPA: hypothetical protein VKA48_01295, partial [Gammaproteobacteria bacterium]|nr:hypothetical protein [Gammaproteobacteria bacterium]
MDRVMPPQALKGKLLVMMVLRVVLAFAFLGVTTWFQVRAYTAPFEGAAATPPSYWALYAVVAAIGGLTIVYALVLGRVRNHRRFAYLQVGVDVALITLIVFVTGGAESYLSTLYLLAVIGSSIVLSRRGGVYAAALSSIAYGVMVDMDFYGMLPRGYKLIDSAAVLSWEDVFTTVA